MSNYGYAIYDEQGRDVTGLLTPVFFLDKFTQSSGSKTYYNQPPGKRLIAGYIGTQTWNGNNWQNPTINVSGNTVSWSGLNPAESRFIYTFWG
ncbi:hypothetical protein IGP34_07785 [Escherichia coli]|uniref:hypothetical protein n=1 Tax=Escherichia coli TaxID=562 RepID=UPI002271D9EE|nr:hypothetical protein [Escherichia coli]MCX9424135.1 hypothetical protein [Escherichia coli]HCJ5618333.1 hypothetical protein [Escherichia coli]